MIIGPAGFGHAPPAAPALSSEQEDALTAARGSWAIIRKGKQRLPPRVRRLQKRRYIATPSPMAQQLDEKHARDAFAKLDVREGWAWLVSPAGEVIDKQSGPWKVRGRGRW